MAKHITQKFIPPLIDNERFNMNGMVPSAAGMRRLAETFNFVSGRCKKQVFMKCQTLVGVEPGDFANVVWRGRFRTGHNTSALRVSLGIALTDYGFSSAPYVQLFVQTTAPVTVLNPTWTFKASSAGTNVAPNELHFVHAITDHELSANTEYLHHFECANGARLVFASLTECDKNHSDDSIAAVCNPAAYSSEAPIYDAHIADLVEANNELWQHNGAHLINWCAQYDEDASAPVTVAASYTNAIDLAATTVTAATPGWNLWTQYHNTVNRTTVPVKLCVLVERDSGVGTFDYRLTDGTNTLGATGASGAGAQWLTTTGTIPAQAGTKWDFQAKVSAGGWRVKAISLFEYEA